MVEILTLRQAAQRYQGSALTPSAIRRLVVSGEIESRRVGAKYLIAADAIENWIRGERPLKKAENSGIRRVEPRG